jgi:hypothetical protein
LPQQQLLAGLLPQLQDVLLAKHHSLCRVSLFVVHTSRRCFMCAYVTHRPFSKGQLYVVAGVRRACVCPCSQV